MVTAELNYRQHKKYREGIFKSKDEIIEIARAKGQTKIFHVLSFGGGTQSSHLLESHLRGTLKHPYDAIIFSDTGSEPFFIHEQVKYWQNHQHELGDTTPFIVTNHKSMTRGLEEMLMRYLFTDYQRFQLPLYFNKVTENGEIVKGGLMPRQCTGDFKITPVQQAARALVKQKLGLVEPDGTPSNKRIPSDVAIIMDIGFSMDEISRISGYQAHNSNYIYLAYPLVEKGLTTQDSIDFLKENNFPSKRSRCYLCPFNCSGERARDIGMDWLEIIECEPLSFLKACFFDEMLRKVQATGRKNMRSIPYFHFSRTPLNEVYPNEYSQIYSQYVHELQAWALEWMKYLIGKYGLDAIVMPN